VRAREIAVRPVQETDRPTVEWLTTQLWGAAEVLVHDGAFYPASRGFRLTALRPGAVDRSRLRKPEIPRTGDFGIPLRDEIDLACPV
jgi:hypothetical protein